MIEISESQLQKHLQTLAGEIGVRLAGTPGEQAAATYISQEFEAVGALVHTEPFPVNARRVQTETLEIEIGDRWHSFPCSLFSSTPGTHGRPVEAPLVFFEAPTEYQRQDLSHLRGKAVVHLGCHIESREHYRRLMHAEPAFLLFVDVRYPGSVPLADGMFPAYTRALGAKPTVNVAYMDAWRWKVENASRARLTVTGGMEPAASANVIADLPAPDADAPIIYVGAHHDTQANSPGADDNGSGVSGLLELARVLAPLPRLRTLRLISFGAEEQLSVGSSHYVRNHRDEVSQRGQFIFNLDSYGSWLGWTQLICNGPAELKSYVRPFFKRAGLFPGFTAAIIPYADHFPFVATGIPGMTLGRSNCVGGRFFHHRPDDDLSRVSVQVMAASLSAVAAVLADASQRDELPFPAHIPAEQAREAESMWNDLFGGWSAPSFTLDQLLAQVTPQNLHKEQEIGPAMGNEAWNTARNQSDSP
jgi:aminopeptidase YwaD